MESKTLPAILMMDLWVSMGPEERKKSIAEWMAARIDELDKKQNREDCVGKKGGGDEGVTGTEAVSDKEPEDT
jgi:hypothetical protein